MFLSKPKITNSVYTGRPRAFPASVNRSPQEVVPPSFSSLNGKYLLSNNPKVVNFLPKVVKSQEDKDPKAQLDLSLQEEESPGLVYPPKYIDSVQHKKFVPKLPMTDSSSELPEKSKKTWSSQTPSEVVKTNRACRRLSEHQTHREGGEEKDSHKVSKDDSELSNASADISEPSFKKAQEVASPVNVDPVEKAKRILSPVKPAAGKPNLLRPLYERIERMAKAAPVATPPTFQYRLPSDASTIKLLQWSSKRSQSTNEERVGSVVRTNTIVKVENEDGTFRLNGYMVGPALSLVTHLQGEVYKAQRDNTPFLIAEYSKRQLQHMLYEKKTTALDALQRQIEVLSLAAHRNITGLEEVIESMEKDHIYIVLKVEFASSVARLVPVDEGTGWDVFNQMLSAVEHLHTVLHLEHNDLHPASFVVDTSGTVKLCWVHSVSPISHPSSQGKDLFNLVAILFVLLFSKSGDETDCFYELLPILKSER